MVLVHVPFMIFYRTSLTWKNLNTLYTDIISGSSWKDVFSDNQRWVGSYYYKTEKITCSLSIYHINKEGIGTVYAGFSDPDTSLELEGIPIVFTCLITFRSAPSV